MPVRPAIQSSDECCRPATGANRAVSDAKMATLVVQRDDAGRAKNGFTQPSHPEQQQQNADDELKEVEGDAAEERAEQNDQPAEHGKRPRRAKCRRPPAAQARDRENDGESLDDFDERSEKG